MHKRKKEGGGKKRKEKKREISDGLNRTNGDTSETFLPESKVYFFFFHLFKRVNIFLFTLRGLKRKKERKKGRKAKDTRKVLNEIAQRAHFQTFADLI